MSPKRYAKDQPAGFTNRIERVAIAGATGTLATHIITQILTLPHPPTITALVRPKSVHSLPPSVIRREVDYTSPSSLTSALSGQQFLIIALAATASPDTNERLIRAAAEAGVEYVMPNAFGYDLSNEDLCQETFYAMLVKKDIKLIEELGTSKWIAMVCGLWYEYSMVMGEEWFGFDFPNKKLTLIDDGETRVNVTTWEQCGRAVAGLLGLKEVPEEDGDEGPSVAGFGDRLLYVSSFLVSQKDMFESWKRISGDKNQDWTITHESSVERYQRGVREMEAGNPSGRATAMFARGFYQNGDGNYEGRHGLDNGVLGLPREDLDECTRKAKGMLEGGYREEKMRAIMENAMGA